METPIHGARGKAVSETRHGSNVTYRNATSGEIVYSGPLLSSTQTGRETYCKYCGGWQKALGILGALGCPTCGHMWDETVYTAAE